MKVAEGSKADLTVVLPGSKSITHRALIASGLAEGRSILRNCLDCEDTSYTASAVIALGACIEYRGDHRFVVGNRGMISPLSGKGELFLGNSGTSLRLLTAIAALGRGRYLLSGTKRLCERPIGELIEALEGLGVKARAAFSPGFPPVLIEAGGFKGGRASLSGKTSSQYLSSLLLAGPLTRRGIEVEVRGELVSRPYVDLTVLVMESFGVKVSREGYRSFRVAGGQGYRPADFLVEGDVSAASYFWAAGAVTGLSIATKNIFPHGTGQGDIGLLNILEEMGSEVTRGRDGVIVRGRGLKGLELDMAQLPDMVPTVAALALFAEGQTTIRNVAHLRYKESDRLEAMAQELRKLGADVKELPDGLIVKGGARLSPASVDPHDDHRIAMALAIVGLRVPGIEIKDRACVAKSFPQFWDYWRTLEDHVGLPTRKGLEVQHP
jgi:3-phosphoshikimate 1-carboxyvinyltransferase